MIGAIDRALDLGQGWREEVKEILKKFNVIVYDPLNKPIDIGDEMISRKERARWKEEGNYYALSQHVKQIRHVDLRMADKADFGIIYIDLDIYACGTWEEYFWMNRQKKPCLLVCKQGKAHIPDWVFGSSPHEMTFDNFNQLENYLHYIDKTKVIDDMGRWLFFDY